MNNPIQWKIDVSAYEGNYTCDSLKSSDLPLCFKLYLHLNVIIIYICTYIYL